LVLYLDMIRIDEAKTAIRKRINLAILPDTQSTVVVKKNNIVDFEKASEPLVHVRRDRKVKKMRSIFKAVRESFTPASKQQVGANRKRKLKKKKRR